MINSTKRWAHGVFHPLYISLLMTISMALGCLIKSISFVELISSYWLALLPAVLITPPAWIWLWKVMRTSQRKTQVSALRWSYLAIFVAAGVLFNLITLYTACLVFSLDFAYFMQIYSYVVVPVFMVVPVVCMLIGEEKTAN